MTFHFRTPHINLTELSPEYRKPNLSEVIEVQKLEHLWACIHDMPIQNMRYMRYLKSKSPGIVIDVFALLLRYTSLGDGSNELGWPGRRKRAISKQNWKARLYTSLCKATTMSVYLAKYYLEPFVTDNPVQQKLLQIYSINGKRIAEGSILREEGRSKECGRWQLGKYSPTPEEEGYLSKFPVYDFDKSNRNGELDAIFDPLADYLTKSRTPEYDDNNIPVLEDDSLFAGINASEFRTIVMVLNAYQILFQVIVNIDGKDGLGRIGRDKTTPSPLSDQLSKIVPVTILLFGVFQPEQILVPREQTSVSKGGLVARPAKCRDCTGHAVLDISEILYDLAHKSGKGIRYLYGEILPFVFIINKCFEPGLRDQFSDLDYWRDGWIQLNVDDGDGSVSPL
ncbi:hypothetical protein ABW19_dt0202494 [Dactylella cylindrospora]|nr:hypothetical protein ABW19_dt0202494 [Dactylella cylindrospora]